MSDVAIGFWIMLAGAGIFLSSRVGLLGRLWVSGIEPTPEAITLIQRRAIWVALVMVAAGVAVALVGLVTSQ